MHIGIDGGCWSNRRGYGRFLRELLEAVARRDRSNQYTVFLDSGSSAQFHLNGNFHPVLVETSQTVESAATAEGRRSVADLLRMSRATARHRLDIFFFSSVYSYYPLLRCVPTVLGIHDTIADRNPHFSFESRRQEMFWRWKVRLALAQADTVLTVSEYSKACITEVLGIPSARIRVINEGAARHFRRMDVPRPAEPFILYVGGISPNKNLPALIRAYAYTQVRRRGVKLLLVGDYQSDGFKGCHSELIELIRGLDIEKDVEFAGYVPDEDVCVLYNQASLFCMPSFDEGFGLPALEAMTCGAPVVVSTGNSLAEVVGDAGLTVDPHDINALRDAIDCVLRNEQLATSMRQRSLARAAAFSWDAAAGKLLAIFEEIQRRSAI